MEIISVVVGLVSTVLVVFNLVILFARTKTNANSDVEYSLEKLLQKFEQFKQSTDEKFLNLDRKQFDSFATINKSISDQLSINKQEFSSWLSEFKKEIQEINQRNQLTIEAKLDKLQGDSVQNNEKVNSILEQKIQSLQESNEKKLESINTQTSQALTSYKKEINDRLDAFSIHVYTRLDNNSNTTNDNLEKFGKMLDARLIAMQRGSREDSEKVNSILEQKIQSLQESNEKKLEQMQAVVDEKLQKTLETRLQQSFETVGKQLESVHQGLGEVKTLADDTKSLKNALINVKDRGSFGELRLEQLLSDILSPSQYFTEIEIENGKRVEFAIKMPNKTGDDYVLLPIDSKFPQEDYNRLIDAQDNQSADVARKALYSTVRSFAKDINTKYIVPPKTTDFAFLYLPTEGLFAEIHRDYSLVNELREKYSVQLASPSTMSVLLNTILHGFKTMAIEQKSVEIGKTLSAVKTEFGKFAGVLDKAHRQIETAGNTLKELTITRTNAINKKLKSVATLDDFSANALLNTSENAEYIEEDSVV